MSLNMSLCNTEAGVPYVTRFVASNRVGCGEMDISPLFFTKEGGILIHVWSLNVCTSQLI